MYYFIINYKCQIWYNNQWYNLYKNYNDCSGWTTWLYNYKKKKLRRPFCVNNICCLSSLPPPPSPGRPSMGRLWTRWNVYPTHSITSVHPRTRPHFMRQPLIFLQQNVFTLLFWVLTTFGKQTSPALEYSEGETSDARLYSDRESVPRALLAIKSSFRYQCGMLALEDQLYVQGTCSITNRYMLWVIKT